MGKELEVNNGNGLCREIRTIFFYFYILESLQLPTIFRTFALQN